MKTFTISIVCLTFLCTTGFSQKEISAKKQYLTAPKLYQGSVISGINSCSAGSSNQIKSSSPLEKIVKGEMIISNLFRDCMTDFVLIYRYFPSNE